MAKTGTKEWSTESKNCLRGCDRDCLYCFETERQFRFKQITSRKQRLEIIPNYRAINQHPRRVVGRIMFPSTHDLPYDKLPLITRYLFRWLEVGNEFLIVSKPELKCIKEFCIELEEFKKQITFRFTIGSKNDSVLKFWEKNAPPFMDRLHALKYAYDHGWETSVSCEPFLDDELLNLVDQLQNYVTDTIWVGKMNEVNRRVLNPKINPGIDWTTGEPNHYLNLMLNGQDDTEIAKLYLRLNKNPKIRWKDSIRKTLHLPEPENIG